MLASDADRLFEVVFDYGEDENATPTTAVPRKWLIGPDSFSSLPRDLDVQFQRSSN